MNIIPAIIYVQEQTQNIAIAMREMIVSALLSHNLHYSGNLAT